MEQYAVLSGLRHVHPGLKAAFTLTVLVLCLALDTVPVSLFLIATMGLATVLWGGVRLRDYVAFFTIPIMFILSGGVVIAWATGGLDQALAVTLRALGAVSAFYFLMLSTPVGELLAVLRACRVPGVILELMYLIYRYVYVLADLWRTMHTAARSRLGERDYATSCRTFGTLAGNLFVLSMRRAGNCYDAMESRCYQGQLCFLEKPQRLRWQECAAAACYVCCMAAVRGIGVWM